VNELAQGAFQVVMDDPAPPERSQVTRLILCSGKIYYDLMAAPQRAAADHVAIARVELLYPVPVDAIKALLPNYPNLREVMWVQEEPRNMGARKFVQPRLRDIAPEGVAVTEASRPERASPAEGYPGAHQVEQARIVAEALA
jgi:2-oxoglutarate dehydrogenase E1 component